MVYSWIRDSALSVPQLHPCNFSYPSHHLCLTLLSLSYWWAGISSQGTDLYVIPTCQSSMGHLTSKPGPVVFSKTLTLLSQQPPFNFYVPLSFHFPALLEWPGILGGIQTLISYYYLIIISAFYSVVCLLAFYEDLLALSSVFLEFSLNISVNTLSCRDLDEQSL